MTGLWSSDALVTSCWAYTSSTVTPLPSDDSSAISFDAGTNIVTIYSVIDASAGDYIFEIQAFDSLSSSVKNSFEFKITLAVNYVVNQVPGNEPGELVHIIGTAAFSVDVSAFFATDPISDSTLWFWQLTTTSPALPLAHSAAVVLN